MNRRSSLSGVIVLLTAIGCASSPDSLDPAAPYPTLGTFRPSRSSIASLIVYTETWIDLNVGSGDDGSVIRPSSYALFDDHGRWVQDVRNYIGATDREPTTLEPDPGRYLIRLDRPGRHPPVFWVVVESGKRTEVDLRRKH